MKILMINHFPLAGSGSGTYTRNLAVHLRDLGHEVHIILPENTKEFKEPEGISLHPVFFTSDTGKETIEGALPFNFPCFTSHPRSITTFADLNEEELGQYCDAFEKAIDEEISTFDPDIIHGQHVWILPSLAVGKGKPLVLTAHGTDLMGYDKWPDLRKYAEKAIKASYAVISISKDNCALIEERFPEEKEKIVMMRNGYDPGIFYPHRYSRPEVLNHYGIKEEEYEGRQIVSFAGKLANFKGIDILLRAAKIYEDTVPSLTLIAGDGDEKEILHSLAEELGLKSVRFLGNVSQEELRKLYNIADVNLVPSRREPFGLVAIEAMACGTPVIASDQGGLPDFVNDSVGALVIPEDPEDLAEKVISTLKRAEEDDGSWRKKIASYAREHYAQDKIIEELDRLFRKAL